MIHGTGHWSMIIFPEVSEANILSTFEQLHQNKDEVFERGGDQRLQGIELELQN